MKFSYELSARIKKEELAADAGVLFSYIDELEKEQGDLIKLASDNSVVAEVDDVVSKKGKAKSIFLVGIGGSSVGTRAVYEAVNLFSREYSDTEPKMYFLNTINPTMLVNAVDHLKKIEALEDLLVIVVSKSGSTTETAVNLEMVLKPLNEKFGENDVLKRIIAVSSGVSPLCRISKEKGISFVEMPQNISGRFSVFTSAGIVPLRAAGVEVETILDSAKSIGVDCLKKEIDENPALASATIVHNYYKKGFDINNTFFFNNELEALGQWQRQLFAESLGKRKDLDGNIINAGITPTVSVGTTDLHSVAQLYLGGPKDKITTFVWLRAKDQQDLPQVPSIPLVEGIYGKSPLEVLSVIYESTKKAYEKRGLPYIEIVLDDLNDVGAFMQFKMMEVIYLAKLLNVNAFDQPAVELYKEEVRRLLR